MRNALVISFFLFACGDNIKSDLPDRDLPEPNLPEEVDGGEGCADFDINVECPPRRPDDPPPELDASVQEPDPDASEPPPLDDETKAACCHALLDGSPPKFECGYPPGICHSGKRDFHCGELTYTLCNP